MRLLPVGPFLLLAACSTAGVEKRPQVNKPPPAPQVRPEVPPGARTSGAYTFTKNGKAFEPQVLSLHGEPKSPRPGDPIRWGDLLVTLGPERDCHLVQEKHDRGRVYLKQADGTRRVVGAIVRWSYESDKKTLVNPLADLSPAEIRGLWGVYLEAWPKGIEVKLRELDPARACVTITDESARGTAKELPSLHPELRCLNVDERSSMGIKSYDKLQDLTKLTFLRLNTLTVRQLDARMLQHIQSLRYLDLSMTGVQHLEGLARLKNLRYLNLTYNDSVRSISFASGLKQLRRLEIRRTPVEDLSPLAGLHRLEEVNANMTKVRRLPSGPMPGLRRLQVMSAPLSDMAVAAFARENPRCVVLFRWTEALRRAAAGVTRVRVRSGGTCHRNPGRESTIFELRDPAKIKELLDHIVINDKGSGFHCMCCGTPTFELYKGAELVAMLGFHHGRSLRWPGGWPGDGALTKKSAVYLAALLARHGWTGPLDEQEKAKRQRAAAQRRAGKLRSQVPPSLWRELEKAKSKADLAAAFEQGIKDPIRRAVTYFRLFGSDGNASWNLYFGPDELLSGTLLPKVDKPSLSAAIRRAARHPAGRTGAARWIFSEQKEGTIDPRALAAVLPKLARVGLSHPRSINRRRTIVALGRIRTPAATRALREVLEGKIEVRQLPKAEEQEPGGMVQFGPADGKVPDGCSDRAHAALLLAQLERREALPTIRRLAARAKGEERKAYSQAIELLQKVPKGKTR
jgi:hypothetical protein